MQCNHARVSQQFTFRLMLGLIFAIFGRLPVQAQDQPSQAPNIQQMQERLQRLEKEVRELKQLMAAAEESSKVAVPGPSVPAETETRQAEERGEQAKPSNSLNFYGYAMLDSGYDFKTNDPNWFDVVRPTKLPAFAGEFAPDGKTYFGVRQTRFGVKSSTETPLGALKTIFEFELFGTGVDAGQTTFRLRHAYGELGQFGAGQTWSPFMDIDVFPNSLEYWGPTGMVFFRNVQVRWTPLQGDSNIVIALERPGASADGGIYADRIESNGIAIAPQFKWPDLSGHARVARDWGYVQVGAIVRKLAWVDTSASSPFNFSGTAIGWGVNVSSNLNFTKKDVGKFAVVYGHGIQNYMNDAPIDVGVKNTPLNAVSPFKGVALPVLGVVSFLDHNWNDQFSTSIGYSMANIDNSNGQTPSDFHQGHYALGNLLYHPAKAVTIGGEFQFGRRVNFSDGFSVNDYRMQFSFRYDWSKGFEF
jgi:hypothetical protein